MQGQHNNGAEGIPGAVVMWRRASRRLRPAPPRRGPTRTRRAERQLLAYASTYDPTAEIVKDVLGEQAGMPDMTFYDAERDQWLDFFKLLGMADSPRPGDLLRHIDDLIVTANGAGRESVDEQMIAVFEHIVPRWEKLAGEPVPADEHSAKAQTFAEALRARAWFPAQRDRRDLRRYPGYSIPEDRLYRPEELELPRNAHLVASQRPIAAIRSAEPGLLVRSVLGFPLAPPLEVVVADFDRLLELWESPSHGGIQRIALERSLGEIYRYFGGHLGDAGTSAESRGANEVLSNQRLQHHYADRACLWDGARFWMPRHVFRERVPYFGRHRVQISPGDRQSDRGYDRLGRRSAPTVDDFVDYLKELSAAHAGAPLDATELTNVLEVLRLLGAALANYGPLKTEVFVPTRDGLLASSRDAFLSDAPWYEGAPGLATMPLLHPSVPDVIVEAAGIDRLSERVKERRVGELVPATDCNAVERCRRWQVTMRSDEFQSAVARLVKHQRGSVPWEQLSWLTNASVVPVNKIETELFVLRNGSIELVGRSEVGFFHQDHDEAFFLKVQAKPVMVSFLAEAINKRLADDYVHDRSLLVTILDTSPVEICALLDTFRVPAYAAPDEGDHRFTGETLDSSGVTFPDTAGDDVPDDTDAQGDGWHDEDGENTRHAEDDVTTAGDDNTASSPVVDIGRTDGQARAVRTGARSSPGPLASVPRDGRSSPDAKNRSAAGEQPDSHAGPDNRAPTTSRHGRSSSTNSAKSKGHQERVTTYVAPVGQELPEEDPTDDELPSSVAFGIGTAAVDRVLAFEAAAGREAKAMPHNNPGYDVESLDRDNDLRYIEVKGIDGPWTDRGVPLSLRQFDFAQQLGERFWLYVVEFARDAAGSKVHPVRNPAGRITEFRFDSGWRNWRTSSRRNATPVSERTQNVLSATRAAKQGPNRGWARRERGLPVNARPSACAARGRCRRR